MFGSLNIGIWNLFVIWYLRFEILISNAKGTEENLLKVGYLPFEPAASNSAR
jgi:hypothetical protein